MTDSEERTLTYREEHASTEPPILPREWKMISGIGILAVLIKLGFFTNNPNVIYYTVGFGAIAALNALGCEMSWDDTKKERIIGFSLAILSYIAFLTLMYFLITA